jgi:hypothetical protein
MFGQFKKTPQAGSDKDIDLESKEQKLARLEAEKIKEGQEAQEVAREVKKLEYAKQKNQEVALKTKEMIDWNQQEAALSKKIKDAKPTPQNILKEFLSAVKETKKIFDDIPATPDSDKIGFFASLYKSMEDILTGHVKNLMADKGSIMKLSVYGALYFDAGVVTLDDAKKLDPKTKTELGQQIIQLNDEVNAQYNRAAQGSYTIYCTNTHLDKFAKMKRIINGIFIYAQEAGLIPKPQAPQAGSTLR